MTIEQSATDISDTRRQKFRVSSGEGRTEESWVMGIFVSPLASIMAKRSQIINLKAL
jgi:hypothetical protein